MKVAIITVGDKRHTTMLAPYFEYMEKNSVNYDIIRSTRYGDKNLKKTQNSNGGAIYEVGFQQQLNVPKRKKLINYLRFRRFAKHIIKRNQYDFLIIWNENTAVLLLDLLMFSFKERYILNIRDQLNFGIFNKLLEKMIMEMAVLTTTPSSYKVKETDRLKVLFNRDTQLEKMIEKRQSFRKEGLPIRLTFMGLYHKAPETFNELANLFGNDNRFELYFYGGGFDNQLSEYVSKKGYQNITTGGAFEYEKTADYLRNTDIVNTYYANEDKNLKGALGVKMGYIPMLYIPGLVDDGTYFAKISRKYGFSFMVNEKKKESLPDDLYNWYHSLNFQEFKSGCDKFNYIVEKSRQQLFNILDKYILSV